MVCITGMTHRVFWMKPLAAVPASHIAIASIRFPRLASAPKSSRRPADTAVACGQTAYRFRHAFFDDRQLDKSPGDPESGKRRGPLFDFGGYPRKRRSLTQQEAG